MVEKIGVPAEIAYSRMDGHAGPLTLLNRHNHTFIRPWAGWAGACGIVDGFRRGGRVEQLIQIITFVKPGTFFVVRPECRVVLRQTAYGTAVRNHIGIELNPVEDVVSPVQVRLTVIVDEYRWVKAPPTVRCVASRHFAGRDERLSQSILEGAYRAV